MKKSISIACLSLALAGAMVIPSFARGVGGKLTGLATGGLISTSDGLISTDSNEFTRYSIEVDGDKGAEIDTCMMVPLRAIAEQLGYQVAWENGTVLVDNGAMHTTVTIGQDKYVLTTSNSELVGMSAPFSLGIAPYVWNDVTYVPLTLFQALLGNRADAIQVNDGKITIRTAKDENTQIANPFTECKNMDEAEKLAGFGLTAPAQFDAFSKRSIQVIKGRMIEVVYSGRENTLSIRKGSGAGDVSGDYNTYAETKTVSVDDLDVTMKGAEGKVVLAAWENDGYSFSVRFSGGVSANEMLDVVKTVK